MAAPTGTAMLRPAATSHPQTQSEDHPMTFAFRAHEVFDEIFAGNDKKCDEANGNDSSNTNGREPNSYYGSSSEFVRQGTFQFFMLPRELRDQILEDSLIPEEGFQLIPVDGPTRIENQHAIVPSVGPPHLQATVPFQAPSASSMNLTQGMSTTVSIPAATSVSAFPQLTSTSASTGSSTGPLLIPPLPAPITPVTTATVHEARIDDLGLGVRTPKASALCRPSTNLLQVCKQFHREYVDRATSNMVMVLKDSEFYPFSPFRVPPQMQQVAHVELHIIFFCLTHTARYGHKENDPCKAVQELILHQGWIKPMLESLPCLRSVVINGYLSYTCMYCNTHHRKQKRLPCEELLLEILPTLQNLPKVKEITVAKYEYDYYPDFTGPKNVFFEWKKDNAMVGAVTGAECAVTGVAPAESTEMELC